MQGGSGNPNSCWAEEHFSTVMTDAALATVRQMLADGISTDITINTADGAIAAHLAVLAARSPVFRSMFSYDTKEKNLATIDITDMSVAACEVFLRYLYGCAGREEFLAHRLLLLRAADKYDVSDLRRACNDSLSEEIAMDNVLETLKTAHLYRLPGLKGTCMKYLVEFSKVSDLGQEWADFLVTADKELVADVVNHVLATWKAW